MGPLDARRRRARRRWSARDGRADRPGRHGRQRPSGTGGSAGTGVGGGHDGAGGNDAGTDVCRRRTRPTRPRRPTRPWTLGRRRPRHRLGRSARASMCPTDGPACSSNALCDTNAVTVTLPGGRFTGTTSGSSTDHGSCGGDKAPEAVFKLVLTREERRVRHHPRHGFDTVIYMRSGNCCGSEVACNDDADNRKTSVLTSRGVRPGHLLHLRRRRQRRSQRRLHRRHLRDAGDDQRHRQLRQPRAHRQPTGHGHDLRYERRLHADMGCLVAPATTSGDGVYYFVLDANSTVVTFSTCTNTCIDTVLYMRDVCTTTSTPNQKSCNDNFCAPATDSMCAPGPPVQSRTTATLGPGVHYLVVDSHSAAAQLRLVHGHADRRAPVAIRAGSRAAFAVRGARCPWGAPRSPSVCCWPSPMRARSHRPRDLRRAANAARRRAPSRTR